MPGIPGTPVFLCRADFRPARFFNPSEGMGRRKQFYMLQRLQRFAQKRESVNLSAPALAFDDGFEKQSGMARVERQKNPTLEQMQQAQAQHRLVMETPQIPPFDQGNLSTLMDYLERIASLENRRQKAKLSGDPERAAELRANQKKLARSEQGRLLRKFEIILWGRVLAGALAQGAVISLLFSLLLLAITGGWSWSPLALVSIPLIWVVMMWSVAPPVFSVSGSPKRARKLVRSLSNRTQTAGVYSLVARPWLTAVVLMKAPRQLWTLYKARKAKK